MFGSLINQFFLVACLFVLLYTGLQLARSAKVRTVSIAWHASYAFAIVGLVVLASVLSLIILVGTSAKPVSGLLPFCLSLALAACASALYRSLRIISQLDTQKSNSAIDNLTGVYDRSYIEDRLATELVRSKRYNAPLAIVMVDLSRFHRFNNDYGFQTGDLVLKTTADIIQSSIRESDIVARYNAKRFIVVLTNTPENGIATVIDRLQRNLKGALKAYGSSSQATGFSNVKFGKACCDMNTRSQEELISFALDQVQRQKCPLNKQDTSIVADKATTQSMLEEAA